MSNDRIEALLKILCMAIITMWRFIAREQKTDGPRKAAEAAVQEIMGQLESFRRGECETVKDYSCDGEINLLDEFFSNPSPSCHLCDMDRFGREYCSLCPDGETDMKPETDAVTKNLKARRFGVVSDGEEDFIDLMFTDSVIDALKEEREKNKKLEKQKEEISAKLTDLREKHNSLVVNKNVEVRKLKGEIDLLKKDAIAYFSHVLEKA